MNITFTNNFNNGLNSSPKNQVYNKEPKTYKPNKTMLNRYSFISDPYRFNAATSNKSLDLMA